VGGRRGRRGRNGGERAHPLRHGRLETAPETRSHLQPERLRFFQQSLSGNNLRN